MIIIKTKYFLIIFVVFLVAGIIYQYFQVKNLRTELVKPQPISTNVFGMIEPVVWTNPENPMASLPLQEKDIPKDAILVSVSFNGFEPKEISVKSGQKTTLALNASDSVHVFKFKNEMLPKVTIGIASGETKVIQFYAPKEKGDYEFFCSIPRHSEFGKMIVK